MAVQSFLQYVGSSSLLCLAAGLFALLYFLSSSKKSVCNLPPGPRPLPLIGNLNVVDLKKPFQSLTELSKIYGNVFTVYFGPRRVVVLAGYETIKDALLNHAEEFGERAEIPIFRKMTQGNGIAFSHGEVWKTLRRFTLSTLRDFGMGKRTLEIRILEEVNSLIKYFESYHGKPFDTKMILNNAVSNVICSILFGERFEYDDPVFLTLLKLINQNTKLLGSPMVQLYNFYPSLGFLSGASKTVLQNILELNAFLQKLFQEHKEELNENDLTGFVDAFLESKKPHTAFSNGNLMFSTLDLFAAGTETTSTTVRWGLLLMMKYPEIQRKIQEEMNHVIEPGELPKLEDRKKMPYTEAVIHEIQRFANIVPMGVSRSTPSDVNFRGYVIPKGTEIIPLLTSALNDELHWKTPDQFNPSHFLDANGNFIRREAFIPFSIGNHLFFGRDGRQGFTHSHWRRACLGEGLAKMELFLFFSGLLRKFVFQPPPGVEKSDLDLTADVGFTLTPMPHLSNYCKPDLITYFIIKYFVLLLLIYLLAEKYGPIFTLHFGFQKVVVLTGYEVVREALVNYTEEFVDRPSIPIFDQIQNRNGTRAMSGGVGGTMLSLSACDDDDDEAEPNCLFFSIGELWRTTRRFTVSSMRNLGMGKQMIEGRIFEELHFLIEMIKSFKGQPFSLPSFNCAPINVTFVLLFGDRFDYKDPTFLTLLRLIDEIMILLGSPNLNYFNFYPFLGFLFKTHKIMLKKIEDVRAILRQYMKASREDINENSVRSYIDALIFKQQEEKNKKDSLFHDDNLMASILDLVMAGTETIATTLQWSILLMMKYPEIQRKVQEEIGRTVQAGSWATYEDRKNMPYTNAVLHEVQRFITLLPHVPRCTAVDTHFRGYFLPKGIIVIPSLTSVLLDKTQWETPHQFNPNHFLDAEGNFVKKGAFLPFSTGRRNCIGESLAKMELFVFFVGLLQTFTFQPQPGVSEADLDLTVPQTTFTLRPQPQATCAVLRE
ncbi:Cytochrome P450 2W1 [Lonchura striata]|uniref:Cytochrome P450 2W1 n=1 Tax=Lonchura striata TaxID=40157 RepID=A0A218V7J0_9PASE|nr:Cytochrome P450 2W1 [Lonchura striata domestica]